VVQDAANVVRPSEAARGNHFADLLSALIEATHPTTESGTAFADALQSLVRLVEADAGARLVNGRKSRNASPLADSGIRKLISGLLDIAAYSSGGGEEFRELRELLESFEDTTADGAPTPPDSDPAGGFVPRPEKNPLSP
jgi:hypothetical protein